MTLLEAAEFLGVSTQFINKMLFDGKLSGLSQKDILLFQEQRQKRLATLDELTRMNIGD